MLGGGKTDCLMACRLDGRHEPEETFWVIISAANERIPIMVQKIVLGIRILHQIYLESSSRTSTSSTGFHENYIS
jgi:hypothetical protein